MGRERERERVGARDRQSYLSALGPLLCCLMPFLICSSACGLVGAAALATQSFQNERCSIRRPTVRFYVFRSGECVPSLYPTAAHLRRWLATADKGRLPPTKEAE